MELLYSLGASKDSLNKQGGTPEDLWSRTHLTNDHQINFWNEERQEVEQIDVTEFKHLTGARFVESLKVSPKKLTEGWLKGMCHLLVMGHLTQTENFYLERTGLKKSD